MQIVTPSPSVESAPLETAVIDLDRIKQALGKSVVQELEIAFTRARDRADSYRDSVKAIAEKAGLKPSVLRAWIKARVEEKAPEVRAKAEQLQLLFDEISV